MLHGIQDLTSQTRDQPMPPAVKVQSLSHWTAREVPVAWMFSAHSKLVRKLPLLFTNEETEAGVPPPHTHPHPAWGT